MVAGLVIVFAAACTSANQGSPVPQAQSSSESAGESGSRTSEMPPQRSLKDLDMCDLLTPADLPVQPDQGGTTRHEPRQNGDACGIAVQKRDVFSSLTILVGREPVPFSKFKPKPGSTDGKPTEIAGRKAWIAKSGDPKQCSSVFGVADGLIIITALDETNRGVDPCDTATLLAEKVIPRTPEPYE